jgi:hypothetical protein
MKTPDSNLCPHVWQSNTSEISSVDIGFAHSRIRVMIQTKRRQKFSEYEHNVKMLVDNLKDEVSFHGKTAKKWKMEARV